MAAHAASCDCEECVRRSRTYWKNRATRLEQHQQETERKLWKMEKVLRDLVEAAGAAGVHL